MKNILSRSNEYIKEYVKTVNNTKYRSINSIFAIEGTKLIEDILDSNYKLKFVLLTEKCAVKNTKLFDKIKQKKTNFFYISDELKCYISGSKTPEGVFAVCCKLDKPPSIDTIYSKTKCIFLYDIQDPNNIGAIIRTADAFGVKEIICTTNCCDLYNLKSIRASMGSIFRVNVYSIQNPIEFTRNIVIHGFKTYATVVDNFDAIDIQDVNINKKSILYFGNESRGLSDEVCELCSYKTTIKMTDRINSLNVSIAASIFIWELFKY